MTDSQMIEEVLRRVKHLTEHVEAAAAVGVTEATIRRWRKGERAPLKKGNREKVQRYIDGLTAGATTVTPEIARAALAALDEVRGKVDELEELWRARLELARASSLSAAERAAGLDGVRSSRRSTKGA